MNKFLCIVVLMGISSQAFASNKKPVVAATPAPTPAAVPEKAASNKIPYASLTPEEREILDNGEIGTGQYVAGGVVGTFFGLGIGQAIQGRYLPTGMIMTVGELASATMMLMGAADCVGNSINGALAGQKTGNCNSGLMTVGVIAFIGFRIWEIVDVWATPPSLNRRYENLKNRTDLARTNFSVFPVASADGGFTGAGLALGFRF